MASESPRASRRAAGVAAPSSSIASCARAAEIASLGARQVDRQGGLCGSSRPFQVAEQQRAPGLRKERAPDLHGTRGNAGTLFPAPDLEGAAGGRGGQLARPGVARVDGQGLLALAAGLREPARGGKAPAAFEMRLQSRRPVRALGLDLPGGGGGRADALGPPLARLPRQRCRRRPDGLAEVAAREGLLGGGDEHRHVVRVLTLALEASRLGAVLCRLQLESRGGKIGGVRIGRLSPREVAFRARPVAGADGAAGLCESFERMGAAGRRPAGRGVRARLVGDSERGRRAGTGDRDTLGMVEGAGGVAGGRRLARRLQRFGSRGQPIHRAPPLVAERRQRFGHVDRQRPADGRPREQRVAPLGEPRVAAGQPGRDELVGVGALFLRQLQHLGQRPAPLAQPARLGRLLAGARRNRARRAARPRRHSTNSRISARTSA